MQTLPIEMIHCIYDHMCFTDLVKINILNWEMYHTLTVYHPFTYCKKIVSLCCCYSEELTEEVLYSVENFKKYFPRLAYLRIFNSICGGIFNRAGEFGYVKIAQWLYESYKNNVDDNGICPFYYNDFIFKQGCIFGKPDMTKWLYAHFSEDIMNNLENDYQISYCFVWTYRFGNLETAIWLLETFPEHIPVDILSKYYADMLKTTLHFDIHELIVMVEHKISPIDTKIYVDALKMGYDTKWETGGKKKLIKWILEKYPYLDTCVY